MQYLGLRSFAISWVEIYCNILPVFCCHGHLDAGRMLPVATPEKIKGNKSLLVAKYKMMATDIIKDNYRISYIPSLKINSHLLKKKNEIMWIPSFFPIIESLSQVNSSQKSERCEKLN